MKSRRCIVCGVRLEDDWTLTLHKFPAEGTELRAKWIEALKLAGGSRIKRGAIPSLSLPRKKGEVIQPKPFVSIPPGPPPTGTAVESKPLRVLPGVDNLVNTNGNCVFCLMPLTPLNSTENELSSDQCIHLVRSWPHEHDGPPPTFNFVHSISQEGIWNTSKMPLICNSCLELTEELMRKYEKLEFLRKQIAKQTKLVDDAVKTIRGVAKNRNAKRKQIRDALQSAKVPQSCIVTTNTFLDTLSGYVTIAPNPTVPFVQPNTQSFIQPVQNIFLINPGPSTAFPAVSTTAASVPNQPTRPIIPTKVIPARRKTARTSSTLPSANDPKKIRINVVFNNETIQQGVSMMTTKAPNSGTDTSNDICSVSDLEENDDELKNEPDSEDEEYIDMPISQVKSLSNPPGEDSDCCQDTDQFTTEDPLG